MKLTQLAMALLSMLFLTNIKAMDHRIVTIPSAFTLAGLTTQELIKSLKKASSPHAENKQWLGGAVQNTKNGLQDMINAVEGSSLTHEEKELRKNIGYAKIAFNRWKVPLFWGSCTALLAGYGTASTLQIVHQRNMIQPIIALAALGGAAYTLSKSIEQRQASQRIREIIYAPRTLEEAQRFKPVMMGHLHSILKSKRALRLYGATSASLVLIGAGLLYKTFKPA
jgi:hypothetical protein